MFKKQFKISNSHSLANKDKKKLRDQLIKQSFDPSSVDAFLDDKQFDQQELQVDKLAGSKVQILTRNKTPYMFTTDSKQAGTIYLPTIYLLFRLEKFPALRIYLKEGVEQYLFNGADLMWPGIHSLNTEDFKQYDIAVIYAKQRGGEGETVKYAPVGVGKILTGKVPDELKGKAVQVEHYLYDELWNMGPRKIPEEIQLQEMVVLGSQDGDVQEEKKPQEGGAGALQDEKPIEDSQEVQEPRKEETEAQGLIIEEESKVPVEEMDARIVEAFYRSLHDSIKDSDLPMEPSDLQKEHLNLYQASEGYKLELKHSSFKRVGKLLEIMHKKGVVEYSEIKGVAHKLMARVYRDNEEFKNYVPKYSLRKTKKQQPLGGAGEADGSDANYPKVEVEEIYEPTKHLICVIGAVKEHKIEQYYSLRELRDLIQAYIKQESLDLRKGMVKVDPILAQLLSPTQINKDNEVAKDILLKAVANHVRECFVIRKLDEEELIKKREKVVKGSVPHVHIKAQKVSNKKVTTIQGLELFQIDYEELLPFLSHKCAGSATINEIEGKKDAYIVQVQGNHIDTVVEQLVKKYKIPQKYIDSVNMIESKKGGKKR